MTSMDLLFATVMLCIAILGTGFGISEAIDRLTAEIKNDFGIPKEFETNSEKHCVGYLGGCDGSLPGEEHDLHCPAYDGGR